MNRVRLSLGLLILCVLAVQANAAMLTGMTPTNYSLPSGWTLVTTQGFESGTVPSTEEVNWGEFTAVRAHTGTKSYRKYYAGDSYSGRWLAKKATVGAFDEIYISMWEYYDSGARFNDELHTIRFEKRTVTDSLAMQVVFDISKGTGPGNTVDGRIWQINEGGGEGSGGFWQSYYGPIIPWLQGTWVQWEMWYKPNTVGVADGFFRIYQNGVLKYQKSNIMINGYTNFKSGGVQVEVGGVYTKHIWYTDYPTNTICSEGIGYGTGYEREYNWTAPCTCPAQCPPDGYVPKFYRYWDDIIVMKLVGTTGGTDVQPPYVVSVSPARSSTGVPVATTQQTLTIKDDRTDDDGIVVSTISMTGPDGTKTCASGLTCTGTTASQAVTYGGMTLSNDEVASFTLTATDAAGNTLNDAWSWTVEAAVQPALNITTTALDNGSIGDSSTQTLAATGGQSPYTWAVSAGTLPTGRTLSTSGVLSGTYTTAGTYNFTVQATDTLAATDTQALTQYVSDPGTTTTQGTTFADTYINGGSTTTNYGTDTELRVYTWPTSTVSNRIIIFDNVDIVAIPANKVITEAKLRLYLTGHDGGGGSNPMPVYVYRISGTLPDTSTVTWANFAGTLETYESITEVALTTGYYDWTVTEAVRYAYANSTPLYLALDGGASGPADTNRIFASVDHATAAYRPQLIVTYNDLTSPIPPLAPTGHSVAAGDGQVTLTPGTSTNADYYNCYYTSDNTAPTKTNGTKIAAVASGYVLTGLTNGTAYKFVFTATNSDGESTVSTTVVATPVATPVAVPDAPTLSTVSAGDEYVVLYPGWSSGATSYNAYYTSDGSTPTTGSTKITGVTNAQKLSSLTNDTTYKFVFTAVNGTGESAVGAVYSATPTDQELINLITNTGNALINLLSGTKNFLSE